MNRSYPSDKTALSFLAMAMSFLLLGMLFGVMGGLQYILPAFLREQLSFQKNRPLHVYLVISWLFTAAQGCMYYFIPRMMGRPLFWRKGIRIHFWLQLLTSVSIVFAFLSGHFGGREYLEFPPALGLLVLASWVPFVINFFGTVRPNYKKAPVYIWSWSAGILFFLITLSESYLWILDYFNGNIIRDITVQWKALGSMVGSWNMLVYGTSMYVMEKISGDRRTMHRPVPFFFFFLGLTNLMFNWGHHTYIVPAAPWVKMVSYTISMTELLILGHIILRWKKTLTEARKKFHYLPYRLLSFADAWIFLNLSLALLMSVPAINFYTHGTHITVAHAMGATIGINSLLLFGCILFIVHQEFPLVFDRFKKTLSSGMVLTNTALVVFWTSLIGSGVVKIAGQSSHLGFQRIMQQCASLFRVFAISGIFILLGLFMIIIPIFRILASGKPAVPAAGQKAELIRH